MTAVEKHPQRQLIIDSILAGKQLKQIAAQLQPPLHPATLCRYRAVMLGRATKTMQRQGPTVSVLKDLAAEYSGQNTHAERLKAELQASIRKHAERREEWIKSAESQDGSKNHRALSAYDRNNLSSIELEAKLGGLLQQGASIAITSTVMMLPRAEEPAAGPVIDVTPAEIEK